MPALVRIEVQGQDPKRELGVRGATLGELLVPQPASGARPAGYWSAEARLLAEGIEAPDVPSSAEEANGRATIMVFEQRLVGVVPATSSSRRIWFSVAANELQIETSGQQGLFRKRPTEISLSGEGFSLTLSDVDQLFMATQRYQAGRERALLQALAK
jgi:hypothetical protein